MRLTLTSLLLAALLPAVTGDALAQERREVPAYREINIEAGSPVQLELHSFVESYRDAWSNEDTEAYIALHVPDTEWINAYARMFTDTDGLGVFLETRLFPAFGPGVSRMEAENMRFVSMRLLGEDAAVIHLYTDGNRGPSAIEGRELRRTHFHLILTEIDGEWKVAHTAIMDARN